MEIDIAPELYEAIQKDFAELISADKQLQGILEKIEKGTATHLETQMYAQRIGECAAAAIKNNLSEGLLPSGKLYYNIAERTIRPTLEHNHELVNQVASQVQQHLNTAAGLGMKPVMAQLDVERVERVVNAAVYADSFEAMQSELGEAIINTTQSFADDFIRENAAFQARSGLSPKITRISTGKCCDWCEQLAGTYDYKSLPDNSIFRRHKYCRCVVTYEPGDGRRQNVHTRQWEDPTETGELVKRRVVGLRVGNVTVRDISQHAYERIHERNVTIEGVRDAIERPLSISPVKYDEKNRPSIVVTGRKATVSINPDTGNISTVYPTHTKLAKKLMKGRG